MSKDINRSRLAASTLLGAASFALLALFPDKAFPLVWIAPILVIEPITYAIGYPSLLADLEKRDAHLVISIMMGTLFAGIWWELWNYYSLPKWTYTSPLCWVLEDFRDADFRIFGISIFRNDNFWLYRHYVNAYYGKAAG